MMKTQIYTLAAVGLLACAGCGDKGKEAPDSTPAPAPAQSGGSISLTPPPTGAPASGAPAAPTPPTEAKPAEGSISAEGLPAFGDDGKALNTQAGLQRAVEYYTRVLVPRAPLDEEEAKTFKPTPPLTDLQQLVQLKIIKAIPPAPAGKKWTYDPQSGKVELK